MSFEDLQKLKEKLGTKVYNEAVFGPKTVRKVEFKRENKNRPREMSAKKPVSRLREISHPKKHIPRDPRFDSLCGTFNPKIFKKAYGFLSEAKKDDIKKLRNELQDTDDPKMVTKIKYLIQRLENQLREEQRSNQKEEKVYQERKEATEAIKKGEKPNFKRKCNKSLRVPIHCSKELNSITNYSFIHFQPIERYWTWFRNTRN